MAYTLRKYRCWVRIPILFWNWPGRLTDLVDTVPIPTFTGRMRGKAPREKVLPSWLAMASQPFFLCAMPKDILGLASSCYLIRIESLVKVLQYS